MHRSKHVHCSRQRQKASSFCWPPTFCFVRESHGCWLITRCCCFIQTLTYFSLYTLLFIVDVAMVIITTMVCKIYFPEALERGQSPVMTRSYSYRIADDVVDNEDYYGSDVSDDEEVDNDECLDSDSSNDGDAQEHQQQASIKNFMEFDQGSMSRPQVLKRLLFCCLVLNITFVAWGVLQVCDLLLLLLLSIRIVVSSWMTLVGRSHTQSPFHFVGTNVDETVSSRLRRVLYLLVLFSLYQPLLDTHHVGYSMALSQTSTLAIDSHLRIFLSFHFQHAQ